MRNLFDVLWLMLDSLIQWFLVPTPLKKKKILTTTGKNIKDTCLENTWAYVKSSYSRSESFVAYIVVSPLAGLNCNPGHQVYSVLGWHFPSFRVRDKQKRSCSSPSLPNTWLFLADIDLSLRGRFHTPLGVIHFGIWLSYPLTPSDTVLLSGNIRPPEKYRHFCSQLWKFYKNI